MWRSAPGKISGAGFAWLGSLAQNGNTTGGTGGCVGIGWGLDGVGILQVRGCGRHTSYLNVLYSQGRISGRTLQQGLASGVSG